jgi:hypothetical protein
MARWNKPGREGRDEVRDHVQTAGRLADERDAPRVPAEPVDVGLDPPQRELLVHDAVVPGGLERGVGEEVEGPEAVVEPHDDDVARLDERGRVVRLAGAAGVGPAVDPHHHRAVRAWDVEGADLGAVGGAGAARDVHVQEEAVLAGARVERRAGLREVPTEQRGVQDLRPARPGAGWSPSEVACRRLGVGYPAEDDRGRLDDAPNRTGVGHDHRVRVARASGLAGVGDGRSRREAGPA